MAKKGKKFYVVWQGVTPGVYDSWADCQLQIKGYPSAKYKSFTSKEQAEYAFRNGPESVSKSTKSTSKAPINTEHPDIIWESISVDAACSGNPGLMEYQGVDTKNKAQIFHKKFELGTNNIGEFLAIVHALALFKRNQDHTPIYTDSEIARKWVYAKRCKTTLVENAKTAELHRVIRRAEKWLRDNSFPNKIMKWNTKAWGEIPADFGRK